MTRRCLNNSVLNPHLQAEKISAILNAANIEIESYWPGLFAKALQGQDIRKMCSDLTPTCSNGEQSLTNTSEKNLPGEIDQGYANTCIANFVVSDAFDDQELLSHDK